MIYVYAFTIYNRIGASFWSSSLMRERNGIRGSQVFFNMLPLGGRVMADPRFDMGLQLFEHTMRSDFARNLRVHNSFKMKLQGWILSYK